MSSTDKALQFAEMICNNNRVVTDQSLGRVYLYRNGIYEIIKSPKQDAELHRMIMSLPDGKSLTPSKRDQVIRNVEAITARNPDDFNPEGIFCFDDGLYDIRYNNFALHSPDYLITIKLPYRYQSCIDAPIWKKFLSEVSENNQEIIDILQEFCGYCLMKSCRFEKALFLIGRGSNGKSVFSDTIRKVFGVHNVSSVSLESLSNPVMRCNILGKYVNIDSDLPRNAERFEEAFRKVSSGEPIQFNEKFVPSFTATPYCKLMYCLNEFPMIDDGSNAFYRRMILIPFNVEFDESRRDTSLKQKLEDELPGIFRWCWQGYNRLIKNGFTRNSIIESHIKEVKADNNPIIAFMDEEVVHNSGLTCISKRGLYSCYCNWCENSGHRKMAFRRFNSRLYNEYKSKTSKDFRYGEDRIRAWNNFQFKNQENATKYQQYSIMWKE